VENLFKKQSAKFIQNRPSFMKVMVKHILVCFLMHHCVYTEQYSEFLEANHCEDSNDRYLQLRELLDALPDCNYNTLKFLMQHLNRVASQQDENKVNWQYYSVTGSRSWSIFTILGLYTSFIDSIYHERYTCIVVN